MKLTQTTGPTLGGQKPKGKKNAILKPEKAEKYYPNEGTN